MLGQPGNQYISLPQASSRLNSSSCFCTLQTYDVGANTGCQFISPGFFSNARLKIKYATKMSRFLYNISRYTLPVLQTYDVGANMGGQFISPGIPSNARLAVKLKYVTKLSRSLNTLLAVCSSADIRRRCQHWRPIHLSWHPLQCTPKDHTSHCTSRYHITTPAAYCPSCRPMTWEPTLAANSSLPASLPTPLGSSRPQTACASLCSGWRSVITAPSFGSRRTA